MGNSKGLAILALLLGAGGLGLGGFIFFNFGNLITLTTTTTTEGSEVQNIWYAEYLTPQTPTGLPTFATLTNMHLVITVNSNESVYISFNAKCTLYHSGAYEFIQVFIYQNGTEISAPYAYVGEVTSGSTDSLYMVSLQHYITGLSAGAYNFSMRAATGASSVNNKIDDTTLIIQTYL